jgi:hypothetical protein
MLRTLKSEYWDGVSEQPQTWLRIVFRLMDSFVSKQLACSSCPFEYSESMFRNSLFTLLPPPHGAGGGGGEGGGHHSKKKEDGTTMSQAHLLAHQHGILLIIYAYKSLYSACRGEVGAGGMLKSIVPPASFAERAFCILKVVVCELQVKPLR